MLILVCHTKFSIEVIQCFSNLARNCAKSRCILAKQFRVMCPQIGRTPLAPPRRTPRALRRVRHVVIDPVMGSADRSEVSEYPIVRPILNWVPEFNAVVRFAGLHWKPLDIDRLRAPDQDRVAIRFDPFPHREHQVRKAA